jgi:hypothetical protein
VAFESIRRETFDRFLPPHLGFDSMTEWQVEWFANQTGTTIGTLAVARMDRGWNYAVLNRDKAGHFQVYKLGVDAYSLDDARAEFMREMAAAETGVNGVSPSAN